MVSGELGWSAPTAVVRLSRFKYGFATEEGCNGEEAQIRSIRLTEVTYSSQGEVAQAK